MIKNGGQLFEIKWVKGKDGWGSFEGNVWILNYKILMLMPKHLWVRLPAYPRGKTLSGALALLTNSWLGWEFHFALCQRWNKVLFCFCYGRSRQISYRVCPVKDSLPRIIFVSKGIATRVKHVMMLHSGKPCWSLLLLTSLDQLLFIWKYYLPKLQNKPP